MKVEKDFEEFIKLLNYHKVKYLVVGAYALIYHTYPRNTGDIDFFVEASDSNAEKIMKVLQEFGFENPGLRKEDFLKPDTIFQMGFRPNRIGIITGITGVAFSEAYKNKVKSRFGFEAVYFISAEGLLKNKKAAARAIDIADVEVLEKFLKKKDKNHF